MWKICGFELERGEKHRAIISVEMGGQRHDGKVVPVPDDVIGAYRGGSYQLPATLICGAEEGKTVVITAGIHSGEYVGIPAVIRAAAEIDPSKVKGNILFIHCVNVSGFWGLSHSLVPEDGFNLNKDYPGAADGTPGERIADYFCNEILPKADFILDFHGGSISEKMHPLIFFPHHASVREASLNAAKELTEDFLVESYAKSGEYSYAADYYEVPGLLIERGEGFFTEPELEEQDYRDIRLLLKYLNVYEYDGELPSIERKISTDTYYLDNDKKGIWRPKVKAGEEVKKGQLIGEVMDFYGNVIREHRFEEDAVVLYLYAGLPVNEGDFLAAYALKKGIISA